MDDLKQCYRCLKKFSKLIKEVEAEKVKPYVFSMACIYLFASVLNSIEEASGRETVEMFIQEVKEFREMLRGEGVEKREG